MKISAVNSQDAAPVTAAKSTADMSYAPKGNDRADDTADKKLQEAVNKLNEDAENKNREIRFAIHKDTHRTMIEVLDKMTNQVVSTFPPKKILDMLATMEKELKMPDEKV